MCVIFGHFGFRGSLPEDGMEVGTEVLLRDFGGEMDFRAGRARDKLFSRINVRRIVYCFRDLSDDLPVGPDFGDAHHGQGVCGNPS